MEEFESEEEKRWDSLYHLSSSLKDLHEDVAFYEHALIKARSRDPEKPFIPTFFLYIYFTFNTIYTIDWENSPQDERLVEHRKSEERERINKMISFCFSDNQFVEAFFPHFIEIMTMKISKEMIISSMDNIIAEGVEIDDKEKEKAKKACEYILSKEGFSFQKGRHVKEFSTFIYKVRCNIVHGTKLTVHADPGQKERILIYSYFLIAVQHMLFMFLGYKANGFFEGESESFIETLRRSHDPN